MNFKSVIISTSALCALIVLASMVAQKSKPAAKPNTAQVATKNDTITCKSGLRYIITQKNPKGVKAVKGDRVVLAVWVDGVRLIDNIALD